jgi:flagellar L-ring protein precursor FlgH
VPALAAAGCAHLGHVEFPPLAPPPAAAYAPPPAPVNGAIYQASTFRPLFEDVRARAVGDTIIIQLVEKTSASRKATTNTNREGSASLTVGDIVHLPFKGMAGAKASGESASKFDGKGETASDVLLSGTLAVTVVQVLPNGNLVVTGEKFLGVNRNVERLRLSGVVNPQFIQPGNTVLSTTVSDARIEVSGAGLVNEAQTMGWMQRVFQTIWPL